jgi:hypothetical protein
VLAKLFKHDDVTQSGKLDVAGAGSGSGELPATSIIKCSFLKQLDKSGFLFSGISPDWNVAAHFLYSDVNYTKFDKFML